MKQSVQSKVAAPSATAGEGTVKTAERAGTSAARAAQKAQDQDDGRDYRSPLDVLAERLQRLNRTSAAVVRETTADETLVSETLLEHLRQAEQRTASIFEALLRRNEETEARTAAVIETIALSTRETEARTANALQAVAQWIEAAEQSPRVAISEAMEKRAADLVDTVARRLDQIEEKLPKLDEAIAAPLRSAIERLEGRLEGLASENHALRELPDTFARAAADLDKKLADVAKRLEKVRQAPAAAPDPAQADHVARIEAKLAGILETLSTKPTSAEGDDHRLATAIEEIATRQRELDSAFARRGAEDPTAAAVTTLVARIDGMESDQRARTDALGERLDKIVSERDTAIDPALTDLRGDIAEIARAIAEASPVRALESLEQQMTALAAKLDASRDRGVSDQILVPIEKLLEDLARKLLSVKPVGLDEIQTEIRGLAARFDQAVAQGIDTSDFEALVQKVGAIHEMVGTVARPEVISDLAARVETLGARIDRLAGTDRDAAMLGRLSQHVGEIRSLMDKPGDSEGLARVEARLDALAAKLERLAAPGPGIDLDDLTRRIDLMHKAIQETRPAPSAADIDSVSAAVSDIRERVDLALEAPRGAPVSASLEGMMHKLAEKLDAAQKPGADESAFAALERQVARIVERLDTSPAGEGSSAVERQLGELVKQLEETRSVAADTARRVAEDVIERKTAGGDSVQRDIADLRSAYDTTDRRMTSALEAVHKMLEKVVERLSDLETDAPARNERAQPAAPQRDIVAELNSEGEARGALKGATPSPTPALAAMADIKAETARVEITKAEIAKAEAAKAEAAKTEAAATEPTKAEADKPAARQPLMPDLPADFPLEPGAAPRPADMTQTGQAEASAEPPAPLDARSSFIAAARRAAQAAAAEVNAGKAKPGAKPEAAKEPTKETAKSAAKVEAAKAITGETVVTDPAAPAGKAGGGLKSLSGLQHRIRDLYVRRRRPILIGLAALVLALGSLQAARLVLPQLRSAPVAAPVSAPAAPAPAAPAPAVVDPAQPAAPADAGKPAGDQQGSLAPASRAIEPAATVSDAVVGRAEPAAAAPVVAAGPSVPSLNETMAGAADLSVTTGSVPGVQVAALPEALEDAVNKGVPRALFDLGSRLADAKGKQRDLDGAAILYRKAAEEGFVPAQYRLAAMYEKGMGVNRDTKTALDWYRRAADGGNVKAMHNMAVLYAEGAATGKPDYAQAAIWFRQAADHGLRDSQYNLAILTARGLGVTASLEGAYQWFSLAANQGDEDAGRKRDEVATKLDAGTIAKLKTKVAEFEAKSAPVLANEETLPSVNWDKMAKDASGA
ncbi:MAG: hypothetical protein ACK50Q_07725 [Labrys sp. (in: a-proteobacteria)]